MRPLFTRVEFDWPVASNGYTVIGPRPHGENAIRDLHWRVVPLKGPTYRTKPFDKFPGLFKQFAALDVTPQGVIKFANKFGLLQHGEQENELASWLQHKNDFAQLTSSETNRTVTLSSASRLTALKNINRILQSGITTEISELGGIVVRPHSLLAAMAFQLGMWLGTDDESIGQCVECGSTWVFGPRTGHRVNRRYCSAKCQDAARYRRKKNSLEPSGGRVKRKTQLGKMVIGPSLLKKARRPLAQGAAVWERRGLLVPLTSRIVRACRRRRCPHRRSP